MGWVIKMKNKEKGNLTPLSTITKVFLIFLFILILKLNINALMLNFLCIISTIEILVTNYKKVKIKWVLMLIQLYTMMVYIPVTNISNPRLLVNGLVYIIILFTIEILDIYIYILKIYKELIEMGRFNEVKFLLKNLVINILKWIIIFIIASMLKINIVELSVLLILAIIDIFLLLVLRNKLLKTIVNLSSYWVLGPIAQMNIMNNNDIINILKIVFYFTLIITFQIFEYYTYKDFEMIE